MSTILRWAGLLACFALWLTACKKAGMRGPDAAMAPGTAAEAALDDASPGAAASTWKRSTLDALTSRLRVGDEQDLPLLATEIRARVDGFRARVMVDFVFDNPLDRQLEGTFQLRLPEGASPYFLAYGRTVAAAPEGDAPLQIASDQASFEPAGAIAARRQVWEQPRQAVMAEREEAAVAYRATVQRRVDPALAEWAGAGVFNARIFPIEAGRRHRVVVGFDVDLTRIGDDLELVLPAPRHGGDVSIELDVAELPGTTLEVEPATTPVRDGGRAHVSWPRVDADRVTVRQRGVAPTLLTGLDPGDAAGAFFATRIAPALPSIEGSETQRAAVFALDTSLSSNPERFEIWRTLMREILTNDRAHIDRFAVMTFDIGTRWYREEFLPNTPSNVEALMRFTDGLALEGATDVGAALHEAAAPAWLTEDVAFDTFLLSDGAATWGEDDVNAVAARWRQSSPGAIFAYDTGIAGGAPRFLGALARDTGGAVFSVVGASEVAAASVAHRARPWEIEEVAIDGGTDIMLEGRPRVLFPGQRVTIVGRGTPTEGAAVRMTLRQGTQRRTVQTALAHVLPSDLAPRRYGQVAVDLLEDLVTVTRPQAVAYARHFRVTGRTCSLVMLETDEDYADAGIGRHDDAGVIGDELASDVVDEALRRLEGRLGDPKDRLLAELSRLANMPGVEAELPRQVLRQVQAMPASAFAITPEPVVCPSRREQDLAAELAGQLRRREPEYDTVVAEAARRERAREPGCALLALSSMVEANPGDAVLARDVAFTAAAWGMHGQAAQLLQRVAHARPWEPITYHALGQTLADAGNPELAAVYYEVALAGTWDARFGDFVQIVRLDYLRLLTASGQTRGLAMKGRARQLRDRLNLGAADLVVTIMWNTDATDVDLHVYEPLGGHVYYEHPTSRAGGRLTADVTQGYGPEMYVVERAQRGNYRIKAHYFASDRSRTGVRTKVYATIIEGFGTPHESVTRKVVTLTVGKEEHDIAEIRPRRGQ